MTRLKFGIVIVFACLLFSGVVAAQTIGQGKGVQTVKILTIGNSFSGNACQYLQQITESVVGCHLKIGRANIGGCSLEKHADLIKASEQDTSLKPYSGRSLKEMLLQEQWDVVTIQQVSHLSFKKETYQPYADQICAFVKKYAPQARIYVHETWAYAPDCNRLKELGITSKQMYQGLKKSYKALSKQYHSPVLPSGDAFYRSFKKNGDLDLWNGKDRFHANSCGCYLSGCVWFAKLFGRSPMEISFVPDGMTAETAKCLQQIAADRHSKQ